MPVIKNTLNGSLIIHLNSGRMVFLEPLASLELQPDDMSSPMLSQFLEEGKVLVVETDAPDINMSELTIRRAKPTPDEGLVYARHMDQLSPGFKKIYGDESEAAITTAYLVSGHILSYEHVEFAEQGGEIIGTLACYTSEQHQASYRGGLKKTLRSYPGFRFSSAFLARFLKHFGPETPNDYYVWALFVDEQFRGQRLGSHLLDRAEARAREYGYGRLVLDVEAENSAAIRLYERRGMTRGEGWPNLPFMAPGAYRMYKLL